MNTIITETQDGHEVAVDIFTKLAGDRILFCNDVIDSKLAADLLAVLLLKDAESEDKLTMFLNTPGGNVRDALMIVDAFKLLSCPLEIVCSGECDTLGALVLSSGTKGMRLMTEHSILSVGQLEALPSGGNLTDAENQMKSLALDNKSVMEILAKNTGKKVAQVVKDFDRRVYMNANDAKKYGLIDRVIKPSKGGKK